MTKKDFHARLGKLIHVDDTGIIDAVMAANIATRLGLGTPVWLVVIGVSSGGKSQVIRPIAVADPVFVRRVDDLTENALISGMKPEENSLLLQIGARGILVISDLTVLFSKSPESREAILGQLRMVYDGQYTRTFGNRTAVTWKGELGVIAGTTPSVYRHFEDFADMGERFMYYRMRPQDPNLTTTKALLNPLYGTRLDAAIAEVYDDYQKDAVRAASESAVPDIPAEAMERIRRIAVLAAKLRTPVHIDYRTGMVDRIPFSEMPMRVALQLKSMAAGLMVMRFADSGDFMLEEDDMRIVEWCAYSLANEERRAILRTLAAHDFGTTMETRYIGHAIGLETESARRHLQQLAAIGVLERSSEGERLFWQIVSEDMHATVRRLDPVTQGARGWMEVGQEEGVEAEEEF